MKMPDKIDEIMFAPCGMNCMVCYKHCYTKKALQIVAIEKAEQGKKWMRGEK